MNPLSGSSVCIRCGRPSSAESIEGHCVSCLATVAFSIELDVGDAAAPEDRAAEGSFFPKFSQYELLGELGRGGMGIVYRARQVGFGREVALKVLRFGPLSSLEERQRLRREAAAASLLRHPNIVTVYEVGEVDGHAFLAMELVSGPTLAALVEHGPLDPRTAALQLSRIADAVAMAHARGILHRDLKPSNVLMDPEGQPRVMDFGLAKGFSDRGHSSSMGGLAESEITATGQLLGSPAYMAPEQADPARGPVTVESDIHSLGAMLYHLLTGRPPFSAPSIAATLTQLLHEDAPPPRRWNLSIPRDLETICLKCLAKEPSRRYSSAVALSEDLRAYLEQRPIAARPTSGAERFRLWCRRRPAFASVLAALVIVTALGILAVGWQWRQNERNLYAADLRVAADAIAVHDFGTARELLARHKGRDPKSRDFAWRFLQARSEGDGGRQLGVHPWIVGSVAWSPDGNWVASGSLGSGTVGEDLRLWDLAHPETPPLILTNQGARELFWFPDSRRFAAITTHDGVSIWDTSPTARNVVAHFSGRSAQLSADGRFLVACDGDPFAWEDIAATNGPVTIHDLVSGTSTSFPECRLVAISGDGHWIARTDLREHIWIHDRTTGQTVRDLAPEGSVWSMTFSPDGRQLLVSGFDPDLRLWDWQDAKSVMKRLHGHDRNTWKAKFSPDGRSIVSGASDQTVGLWDVGTLRPLGFLRGHGSEVWCVAFSPDGHRIVSGGKDRAVRIWSAQPAVPDRGVTARNYSAAFFSSSGDRLATLSTNFPSQCLIHDLVGTSMPVTIPVSFPLAFARGGREMISIAGFWLVGTPMNQDRGWERELEHESGERHPLSVVATPDGQWVAGGEAVSGRISLWSAETGRRRSVFSIPPQTIWSMAVSSDGMWVIVVVGESGAWLCGIRDGQATRLTAHADQIKGAAFSIDNRLLATSSVDATVKLWDLASLTSFATLRGHLTEATGVAFASDHVTLASIEYGQGVRIWHLPTLREVAVIPIPEAGERVEFSPDGRFLAVQLTGGRMRLIKAP